MPWNSRTGSSASHATLHVHQAGDVKGYRIYGEQLLHNLKDQEQSRLIIRGYGDAWRMVESIALHLERYRLTHANLEQLQICSQAQYSIDVSGMRPSNTFSDDDGSEFECVLHEEDDVRIELRSSTSPWSRLVYKTYQKQTMPCHWTYIGQMLYEIDMHQFLEGVPHMLQLAGFYCNFRGLTTLVFPYLEGDHVPVSDVDILRYMRQLLEALVELWHREIVHCNIKKDNIIFDQFKNLTVIDFESAVRRHELIDQTYCTYEGNPGYTAPEVLEQQSGSNRYGRTAYGRRRDIYSAGVVFAELLLRKRRLFKSAAKHSRSQLRERKVLRRLTSEMSPLNALQEAGGFKLASSEFNHLGADLCVQMLAYDRFDRIDPKTALQHPFFKQQLAED